MKKIIIALLLLALLLVPIPLIADNSEHSEVNGPSVSYAISPDASQRVRPASMEAQESLAEKENRDWAFQFIAVDKLQQVVGKGAGVTVAILDTGVDKNHEDLTGKVIAEIDFTESGSTDDVYGHGTFVAGIIAAADNFVGITGVAPEVGILNVKVADDSGHCQAEDLAAGVIWAANMNADVINISIQIKDDSTALKEAIEYAWTQGSVIVAAAGNNIVQSYVYPAAYDNVISVAAVDRQGELAPLSNYGDWVDLAAPGHQIYSLVPGNRYEYETGTSFATAFVTGIAAVICHQVADLSGNGKYNDEVAILIKSNLEETSDNRVSGIVDVAEIAAKLAKS